MNLDFNIPCTTNVAIDLLNIQNVYNTMAVALALESIEVEGGYISFPSLKFE